MTAIRNSYERSIEPSERPADRDSARLRGDSDNRIADLVPSASDRNVASLIRVMRVIRAHNAAQACGISSLTSSIHAR
jgi:hypothetical protein